jgi:hypothetical protein
MPRQPLLCLSPLLLISTAHAQEWSVTRLMTGGVFQTNGIASGGGTQAGAYNAGGFFEACLWRDSAESWISLHPRWANSSFVAAADAGIQGGFISTPTYSSQAAIWYGAATTLVNLHPPQAIESRVSAVHQSRQGGYYFDGDGLARAALWSGTADSMIELTPPGITYSAVLGMHADQQVGEAGDFGSEAALWRGTPESFVSLHPLGYVNSIALGADADSQVGFATAPDNRLHASLWSGTAASHVDLHPSVATHSIAHAAEGGIQVGTATVPVVGDRAVIWWGTAESVGDLSGSLDARWRNAEARDISIEGHLTRVVGFAQNRNAGRVEAILWSYSSCVEIAFQPVSATVDPASPVSFTVVAAQPAGTTYRWFRSGTPVDPLQNPSALTSTLTIPAVSAPDAGTYACVLTKSCGSFTSSAADLDIRCPNEQVTRAAGLLDAYAQDNGPEPSAPRAHLADAVSNTYFRKFTGFDDPANSGGQNQRIFAHSIQSIPADILTATLSIRLRASDSQGPSNPRDDTIALGFADTSPTGGITAPGGPFWTARLADFAGVEWRDPAVLHPLVLDLATLTRSDGANVLSTLRTTGTLDIIVENGTEIDSLTLTYTRPPSQVRPSIHVQPADQIACAGTASFSVRMNDASRTPIYSWSRDGQPIDANLNPSAATARLVLTNVTPADAGPYVCLIAYSCGGAATREAFLTVCPADYNCDGFTDFFDYDTFAAAYELGNPDADFNGDGFLDFFDYDDYVAAFEQGC